MAHETHSNRLANREATARERARTPPTLDDDTDTLPIITEEGAAATRVGESTPDEWQVGDIVAGRFVLRQRLGRGRYGLVFNALDRALSDAQLGVEHHVVLEELPPWIAERATFIECLEQLRLHPQSWSHPNIAKVLDFGRDGDKYFFCEQLLEGASLRVVLDANAPDAFEEHEVLGILRYVGDALRYAHAKGIVHGDLRLSNVFVTDTYEVKLTGFLPSTEPRPKPVFIEDRSSSGRPHTSDDVYGLACIAYELLTRRHPYDGKTPLEALGAGLTAHPPLNLSPPRWQGLSRGLALRRERRLATINEFLLELGVTGAETLGPGPKTVERAPPRAATTAETTPWRVIAPVEPEPFAEIYPEPTARVVRHRSDGRRTSPVRTMLGVALAAGLAAFAYLNHMWLRDRAAGFMETAAALVLPRSVPTAAAPAATEPPAAPPSEPHAEPPVAPPVSEPRAEAPAALPAAEIAPPAPAASAPVAESAPPPATPAPTPAEPPALVDPTAQQPAAAPAAAPEPPRFAFAERTLTVNEGEGTARVMIRRTGSLEEAASVVWWTTDGTAVADEDYAVLGARVARFAAGEDTQILYIPLIADSLPESRESFIVNMRAERPGGAAMQLEIVVLDDDR
jgi:hypothetical protein